jgi:hypothetical protein
MTPRDRVGRWSSEEEPEFEPEPDTEEETDGHGSLAAGMSVGILAGAGIVAVAIRYPIVWLIPIALGIVWIVVNERRLKINNPSPTDPDPAPVREEGPGEGPWPGVRRVDTIGGDIAYIIHPQPFSATETETENRS